MQNSAELSPMEQQIKDLSVCITENYGLEVHIEEDQFMINGILPLAINTRAGEILSKDNQKVLKQYIKEEYGVQVNNVDFKMLLGELKKFHSENNQPIENETIDNVAYEEQLFQERCNPEYDAEIASEVEARIANEGYGPYIKSILSNMTIGDTKDLVREINILFGVCNGQPDSSCFLEAVGDAEMGKSHMQKVIFDNFIPEEYIINAQHLTEAVVRDYEGRHFSRRIINRGDLGHMKPTDNEDPVFAILKGLITDKKMDIKRKKINEEARFENTIIAETCCMAYSSVNSLTKGNNQLESRTTSFTPSEELKEEIYNFQVDINNPLVQEGKLYAQSQNEAKKFKEYFKRCVNFDGYVLVEHMKHYVYEMVSSSGRQELIRMGQRILEEFRSYCTLTHNELLEVGDNVYAPTTDQLFSFVNLSIGETFVDPLDYGFRKDLVEKGARMQPMTQQMIDNVLNECVEQTTSPDNVNIGGAKCWEDLSVKDPQYERVVNYFKKHYTLQKTAKATDKACFFSKSNLKQVYKNTSGYKNIKHKKDFLQDLCDKGILGKLEEVVTGKKFNYYYVVDNDIDYTVDTSLYDQDIDKFNEYLERCEGVKYRYEYIE